MSLLAHCGLAYLLSTSEASRSQAAPFEHKYTVLLLHLDYAPAPPSGKNQPVRASVSRDHESSQAADGADPAFSAVLRPFVLPPFPRTDPVTQTIMRLDVPPEIQLHREVPLPTVLLGSGATPIRAFDAPPARSLPATPRPALELPKAPQLPGADPAGATTGPNLAALLRGDRQPTRAFVEPAAAGAMPKPTAVIPATPELAISNPVVTISLNLADLLRNDRLPVRPFVAPPTHAATSAALNVDADLPVAPQYMGANSTITISDLNLAALPRNDRLPTKPFQPPPQATRGKNTDAQTLASPPQIASSDFRASSVIGLLSLPDAPVYVAVAAIPPANQIAALGPTGSGGAGNGSAGASSSKEATSAKPAGSSPEDLPLRGTTQLSFPRDGKFGAVVLGSSAAAPYIESVGTLSGKFVYSAFVAVGLRKKWILQYSLSKTEEQKLAEKGRAEALEAPWPYRIVRPDQIGAGSVNYILVRGVLTLDGRFDHLALLFPTELDNSDLLMRALKQWIFRPATRDGEPTPVDILLIIPTQSD